MACNHKEHWDCGQKGEVIFVWARNYSEFQSYLKNLLNFDPDINLIYIRDHKTLKGVVRPKVITLEGHYGHEDFANIKKELAER
jgi:hypothetical protein